MKKLRFLAVALLATFTMGLVGCDKDKDLDYTGETLNDGAFVEFDTYGNNNPKAAYKLHFKVGLSKGQVTAIGLTSPCDNAMIPSSVTCPTGVAVVDMGKVKGLSLIETLPADDQFKSTTATANEKHGYVIKVWGDAKFDLAYDNNPDLRDPAPHYMRLWLEKEDGSGFKVRYEFPWTPAAE